MASVQAEEKISLENIRTPDDNELVLVSEIYEKFYKWRSERQGLFRMFQNNSLEDMLSRSREIFWNSTTTASEDLEKLGLNFSIGFARKEVKEFLGRLTTLNIAARMQGDKLDGFGVKVLQAIYKKWRLHSNDKVEKFWELLYAIVNGTLCKYIGYNDAHVPTRFLRKYNKHLHQYEIQEGTRDLWDDVWGEICPLEDIYLPKYYERNIQKQGQLIWRSQIKWREFKEEFKNFDNAEYVYPGNRLAEDSLYYRLLSGTGVTTTDKVEVMKYYDVIKDRYVISANGIHLNPLGSKKTKPFPMPFNHKKMPFVWGILDPIDEKLSYGMPMPFSIKDPHKILNTAFTMLVEKELRNISPPVLSSDLEAPDIIFGDNRVIPVNDISAYKEFKLDPTDPQFFATINNVESIISQQTQGGASIPLGGKQPKSAKQASQEEYLKQLFVGNVLVLYYDILRQEIELVVKTALQFYPLKKYEKLKDNIVRAIKVPDMSLTGGGVGDMEVRLVKKAKGALDLLFESIQKSFLNGRLNEIVEVPLEVFEKLEFDISEINLEPEQPSEAEALAWVEKVLDPMVKVFMPMGMVDPQKLMLRYLEKVKEHPADYIPDKILPQLYALWQSQYQFTQPQQQTPQMPKNLGQMAGNLQQIQRGMQFGGQNQGQAPQQGKSVAVPFGSPQSQPLPQQ